MFNRIFTKSIIISEGGWVVSKLTSEPPKIFQYYIFGHKFSFCEEKIQLFQLYNVIQSSSSKGGKCSLEMATTIQSP